jgi:hypothetical protein
MHPYEVNMMIFFIFIFIFIFLAQYQNKGAQNCKRWGVENVVAYTIF